MGVAVESSTSASGQSTGAQESEHVESTESRTVDNSSSSDNDATTSAATTPTISAEGRDSRIGEQSFAAAMKRDAIVNASVTPAAVDPNANTTSAAAVTPPGQTDAGPLTFTADDKIQRFVYPGTGKFGPDATPQEAADFIRSQEMGIGGDYRTAQSQFFTQALEDHKGDTAWTQQFFRALGTDKTAEIINNTMTPGTFQYQSTENREKAIATVRNAISDLAQNPQLFNQADMNQLVGKMADKGFNAWVGTEIFAKAPDAVKDMFVNAAATRASDPKASGSSVETMAAAATNVLASTSYEHQLGVMNQLNKAGTLDGLIQKAMAGPREIPTFSSVIDATNWRGPAVLAPFSRVEGLVTNVAYASYTDGHTPSPLGSADLEKLQTSVFNSVAQSLTNKRAEENFKNSDFFRYSMATLFTDHFDSIMNSGLGTNGAGFDTLKFQPGLEKFFQNVLFTDKPDSASKQVGTFLANRLGAYGQGLTDTSPDAEQKFRDQFGRSRIDGAAIAGGLLGMMTNAIKDHNDVLKKNAEAQADAIKLVLDIGIGFIPGAGKAIAGQVESAIAKKILETTLGKVQDKVIDLIKQGALDQAKAILLDQFKNKDPQEAAFGLFNALNQTIPNGDQAGEPNFLTQFQSSYNTAINSPSRATR